MRHAATRGPPSARVSVLIHRRYAIAYRELAAVARGTAALGAVRGDRPRSERDRQARVDGQDVAVHVGRGVGGEKDGRADQLVGPAPAPERDAPAYLRRLRAREERRVHLGEEEARRD